MNRKAFQAFTALMWLALPFTALSYWRVWDRLPLRMATHFGINGQPNGWMSRETALHTILGIIVLMLAVFSAIAYAAYKAHAPDAFAWAFLGFFYLVIGFVCAANQGVIQFNLDGQPQRIDFWIVVLPVAVLALAALFLGTKRGPGLPAAMVIAEESHGSRPWSLLFIALLVAQAWAAVALPSPPVRWSSILLGLLFAGIAIHTWTGFQYVFTDAGLEIRTLGFRLRSIAREEIERYSIESWTPLRGYGIRGIGNSRAYVWCNRGVRIQTSKGEVFLGHDEPERIIRDLDSITLKQADGKV